MGETLIGYKLFRVRKNGTIGSLFINRRAVLPIGVWLQSEMHPTKGYKFRPFWHCLPSPEAPHLTEKGREWYEVEMEGVTEMCRPKSQGGVWYLAERIYIWGANDKRR